MAPKNAQSPEGATASGSTECAAAASRLSICFCLDSLGLRPRLRAAVASRLQNWAISKLCHPLKRPDFHIEALGLGMNEGRLRGARQAVGLEHGRLQFFHLGAGERPGTVMNPG